MSIEGELNRLFEVMKFTYEAWAAKASPVPERKDYLWENQGRLSEEEVNVIVRFREREWNAYCDARDAYWGLVSACEENEKRKEMH